MAKLFDENGAEVVAFTAEELKAKQEEAVAEHLKNNPDKSSEIEKLKADLEAANKKLEDGGMNDGQKQRLLKEKQDAEKNLTEGLAAIKAELESVKNNMVNGIKNKALTALSKGDADIKAKIDLKFVSLMKTGDFKNDEEGITQALTEAATIVTGNKPSPNFMDGMAGAGERGAPQKNGNGTIETENSKAIRQVLGIKDADVAKVQDKISS